MQNHLSSQHLVLIDCSPFPLLSVIAISRSPSLRCSGVGAIGQPFDAVYGTSCTTNSFSCQYDDYMLEGEESYPALLDW